MTRQCFGIFRQVDEISKWHRDKGTPHIAALSDKNSIEFTVLSVTVTVSDSCSSRCGSRALDSILWRRISAGELPCHANTVTVHRSGYRIFQLKNPFIPDSALSENGAIRRYSLQCTSRHIRPRRSDSHTYDVRVGAVFSRARTYFIKIKTKDITAAEYGVLSK